MSQGPVIYLPRTASLPTSNHGSTPPFLTTPSSHVTSKFFLTNTYPTTSPNSTKESILNLQYYSQTVASTNESSRPLPSAGTGHDTLTSRQQPSGAFRLTKNPLIINTDSTPPTTSDSFSTDLGEPPTSSTQSSPSFPPSLLRAASSSFRSLFRRNGHRDAEQGPSGCLGIDSDEAWTRQNSQLTLSPDSPCSSSPLDAVDPGMAAVYGYSAPTKAVQGRARAPTGFSLKEKIKFATTLRPPDHKVLRSPSLDNPRTQRGVPDFAYPANAGVGLKARRMSASLPEDFYVDSCELGDEFVSASKIPGRRGREIGKGATATVKVMCRRRCSKDVQYAVKEFRKRGQKENEKDYEQKVKSEFSIANSLHHPNIVKTVRLCHHAGRWNHVMEHCVHGELYSLVQKGYLLREDNLCLFKQLLQGIAFLHQNGIAHRDVKLENLLLSSDGHLKITDFGVSEVFSGIHPGLRRVGGECGKSMGEVRKCSPGICGSLPYIAPEVLAKQADYDPRPLDVWSCAIVCLALFFKGTPWQAARPEDTNYARFLHGWERFLNTQPDGIMTDTKYPSCGRVFSALPKGALRRLLLRMLHPDPEKRITIHDALMDRWVKTIECCCPDPKEGDKMVYSIDAADKSSSKLARMRMQKVHNHLPPDSKR